MPRQNRVDPRGRLITDPARGSWMGNRGVLHDRHGEIRRNHALERWIICELEFKGRRRSPMTPGQYTELFFYDEATALAAGHRPCAECRRARYTAFRAAWTAGNPGASTSGRLSAPELDRRLHRDRIAGDGSQATFTAPCGKLPDGTFVTRGPEPDAPPELLRAGELWAWQPSGYATNAPAEEAEMVRVLTPRSTVNAIAAGYRPEIGLP
jgi:hypothetical protein